MQSIVKSALERTASCNVLHISYKVINTSGQASFTFPNQTTHIICNLLTGAIATRCILRSELATKLQWPLRK